MTSEVNINKSRETFIKNFCILTCFKGPPFFLYSPWINEFYLEITYLLSLLKTVRLIFVFVILRVLFTSQFPPGPLAFPSPSPQQPPRAVPRTKRGTFQSPLPTKSRPVSLFVFLSPRRRRTHLCPGLFCQVCPDLFLRLPFVNRFPKGYQSLPLFDQGLRTWVYESRYSTEVFHLTFDLSRLGID